MSKALLHTQNLKVGYGDRAVVDGVTIEALRGGMICLLGPNGAGKSTILRTLSGMLAPIDGFVHIEDTDIRSISKANLAKRMALVLTERLHPGLLTAFEIVSMGRHPYTGFFGKLKDEDCQIVWEALKSVNAQDLARRFYNELSDGEKQKIMIARALAQNPELIILDEPTSHLDIRHRIEVVSILSKLCREKGITVIMALHDIDLALKGCQTVLMVKNGEIVSMGTPEQIVRQGVVQELYDISDAHYDDLLGSLELGAAVNGDLFVVAGGGSGIPVFRALRRANLGIDCGVLHKSDVDNHVAAGMCGGLVTESDFTEITEEHYYEALSLMVKHSVVIDTGFQLGDINCRNRTLLFEALDRGLKVYTIRSEDDNFTAPPLINRFIVTMSES